MKRTLSIITFLYFGAGYLAGQDLNTENWRKSENDSMMKAQTFYDENLLDLAVPIFMNLQKQHSDEVYLQYVTGVSALSRSDLHKLSLEMLQKAYAKKIKVPDLAYNMARALHQNYKFNESLAMLEEIKKNNKKLTPKQKEDIDLLTVYCNNAKNLTANPKKVIIENLGSPPNTKASEYVPVLSANEQTMIYTYVGDSSTGGMRTNLEEGSNGRYFEDVYISQKKNGFWQNGKSIGNTINTIEHDAAVSLSPDGYTLFTFRDDHKHEGDLYVSYLQGEEWTIPESLKGDVNKPDSWEGSCSMSADGKTLYFASDRKGGYGRRDLYKATKMSDGSWGDVKNMGTKINSKQDEDAPFIHPDGKLLIFSSRGEKSMGDYDLFKTIFNATEADWSVPENLGYPINSPDRDSYYVLSTDGKHGYYSSEKEGGQGLEDIYIVAPGLGEDYKPELLIAKGIVTFKGKPVEAEVTAFKKGTKVPYNLVKSNSEDGKYVLSLENDNDYELIFTLKNYPLKTFKIDGAKLKGYIEQDINIELFDSVVVKGKVRLRGQPVEAEVLAYKNGIDEPFAQTKSNAKTGLYLLDLPNGFDYSLLFKLKKYPFKTFKIETAKLNKYNEYDVDIEFSDSAAVKGVVTLNGKPVEAQVYAYKKGSTQPLSIIKSNAEDGKYAVNLVNGYDYTLLFKLKGYPYQTFEIDASDFKGYNEHDVNIEFPNATAAKETSGVTQITPVTEAVPIAKPIVAVKKTFILANVLYETNKFELTESSKKTIDTTLFRFLNEIPAMVIEVSSHTDDQGSDGYNNMLSKRRADGVVNYLVSKGIQQKRLKSRFFGESKPIADNTTEEGRAKNRRTEFKIITQ
jgi:outer membrane protein OmpA-like peptidoglycan-associated protein